MSLNVFTVDAISDISDGRYEVVVNVGVQNSIMASKQTVDVESCEECLEFIHEVSVNNSTLVVVNKNEYGRVYSLIYNQGYHNYPRIISTVDVVPIALIDNQIHIGLQKRTSHPYKGEYALPGQFIHLDVDKTTDDTVSRIIDNFLATGDDLCVEQVGTVAGIGRDIRGPNGWAMSVVYFYLARHEDIGLMELKGISFFPLSELPKLAFDHIDLINMAVKRFRDKSSYSNLPMFVMPETFSLVQLIEAYETIVSKSFDQSSFRRKIRERNLLTDEGKGKGKGSPQMMRKKHGVDIFEKSIV